MATYDDQKQLATDKDLQEITGISPDEESAMEREAYNGATYDIGDREANPDSPRLSRADKDEAGNYNADNNAGGGFYKSSTKTSPKKSILSQKKYLVAFGASGLGFFLLLALIIFISGSLQIQNLAQHITQYNMVRVSRTFREGVEDQFGEELALNGADEAKLGVLKSKYGEFRSNTWGKLDRFRPQKVIDNLQADGRLQFVYDEVDRKILPGKKLELKSVRIDGTDIPVANEKFGRLFSNSGERVRFNGELQGALSEAVPEAPNIVRSKSAKLLRSDMKIGLSWWDKAGGAFRGKNREDAFKLSQQEANEKIQAKENGEGTVPQIKDEARDANEDLKNKIKNGEAPETQLTTALEDASGKAVDPVVQDARNSVLQSIRAAAKESFAVSALKGASTVYQIALPVCIVYDGSIQKSPKAIDDKSTEYVRTYYRIATIADQAKSGDTTPEAVGGARDSISNVRGSVPELRANGQTVDTTKVVSGPSQPEVGGNGQYTAINAIFDNNPVISKFLNEKLDSICNTVLDPKFAAADVAAEIGLAIVTGGSDEAAGKAAAEVAEKTTEEIVKNELEKTLTQKIAEHGMGLIKNLSKDTAIYGSLTLLVNYLTQSRMNATVTGLEVNNDLATAADIGGNLHQNQLEKTMGGRPLTNPELSVIGEQNQQDIAEKTSRESVYQRYLAITNADSLAATMSFGFYNKISDIGFRNGFALGDFLNNIPRYIGSIISPSNMRRKVSAASVSGKDNYNIVQWGWSIDELNKIKGDPTYQPLENAEIYTRRADKNTIETEYKDCFTKTMGELLASEMIVRDDNGQIVDRQDGEKGKCSPSSLGPNNPKYGDGVFRYRLTMRNDAVLDHLLEAQNPTADSGGGSSSNGGTGETGLLAPGALAWPVRPQGSRITTCYGKIDALHSTPHSGLDIAQSADTPIFSVADGDVEFVGPAQGYGDNFVIIKHASGLHTSYGHMNSATVAKGDHVTQGQQIGTVGSQGYSSGAHLHLNLITGTDNYAALFNGNADPLKNGLTIPPGVPNLAGCEQ